uniref:EH domain-containing protein n=1 Tax=Panagrellus redivivus TaxID=6233 RepID=A0A7E4VET5_PANRE
MTTVQQNGLPPGDGGDDILNQIFSAVTLTPVNYEQHEIPPTIPIVPSERPEQHANVMVSHDDESAAIRQLDDILQHQNSSLFDDEPSDFEGDDLPIGDLPDDTTTTPRPSRNNSVSEVPNFEVNDSLQTARLGGAKTVEPFDGQRSRSWTFDSSVSASESRVGGFDLVDANDTPQPQDINLYHGEVAYYRPLEDYDPSDHSTPVPSPLPVPEQITVTSNSARIKAQEEAIVEQVKKARAEAVDREQVHQTQQNDLNGATKVHEKQVKHVRTVEESHRNDEGPIIVSSKKLINNNNQQELNNRRESKYNADHAKWLANFQSDYHRPIDMYEDKVPISPVLAKQLRTARHVDTSNFRFFIPQNQRVKLTNNIEKITFGGQQAPTKDDKSVLLFGPVSSGKTSFVYTLINYLYDVQKEHDIRFCIDLLELNRSTHGVYVYVFNNTIFPYSITIIDTPGVPDKKGYTKTSALIRQWFELELQEYSSLRIDAISIVMRHDEGELGWPLINELAAVKRLLKDELRTNVMPITTFGEVLPQPQALRSIVFANIPFVAYYKVNNVAYMPKPAALKELRHNLSFKHSASELERYFDDLTDLVSPLLAVRSER